MDERGITYTAHLVLTWQPVDAGSCRSDQNIDEHNRTCLQQALLLDDLTHVNPDEMKSEAGETARLEKKLDLVFTLLSHLITHQQEHLPHTDCTISYRTLEWLDNRAQTVKPGDELMVLINIHPLTIKPMSLYGKVIQVTSQSITIDFSQQDSSWQDLLEKYLFLQHRRQIAAQRH